MNPLSKAAISSIYASLIGSCVVLIGFIPAFFTQLESSLQILTALSGLLFIFSITFIVCILLALIIGSPTYYVLTKFGLANYLSASVLGATFILSVLGFNLTFGTFFWMISGMVTGSYYHYVYTKHTDN